MPEILTFGPRDLDTTGLDSEAMRVLTKFKIAVDAIHDRHLGPGFGLFLDILDTMRVTSTGQVYCRSTGLRGGQDFEISIIRGKVVYINDEGEADHFSDLGLEHVVVLESKKRALMLSQMG